MNNSNNTLGTVTFNNWDDVEAAAMNSYYIVIVSCDRNDFPADRSYECSNESLLICGDGFCNNICGENCPADCSSKYKLEITSVTVTEDAKIKLTNPTIVPEIPWREYNYQGKYAINYAMAIVHTDGSKEFIEEKRFDRWKKRHISKRYVDEANITGTRKHNGGTDHQHDKTQLLSDNFVPLGPNGDRIYLIFWEDDWRPVNTITLNMNRLPGNQSVGSHTFDRIWSCLGQYPFGTKVEDVDKGTSSKYYGDTDPFPTEHLNHNDHFLIIDYSDFTVNQAGTEGTWEYNDSYQYGDNAANPKRGGVYGLSVKLKWTKTL